MGFNFNELSEISAVNEVKSVLAGNTIHKVTFEGCESVNYEDKKDASHTFKVLRIKFSNDQGYFTHTIWEPQPEDFQDTETPYKNPSRFKSMMQLIRHLIVAVDPELFKKIASKELTLNAETWDGFRKNVVEATKASVGKEVEIKLFYNKKGEPCFPVYFLNYRKDGGLYMSTNFIGHNLAFTPKEMEAIKRQAAAAPTTIDMIQEEPQKPSTLSFEL